jgi:hypothetical protein
MARGSSCHAEPVRPASPRGWEECPGAKRAAAVNQKLMQT